MDIFKIVILGITVVVLSALLKNHKSEYAIALVIISGTIFFTYIINVVSRIFEYLINICSAYGVDTIYFEILIKTLGISYICEFAAALCRDSGESAVAVKIDIAGKVTIILMTLPLFKSFIDTIIKLMP